MGELPPLRQHRFASGAAAVEIVRDAPPIDRHQFRQDLDDAVDQDVEPRG